MEGAIESAAREDRHTTTVKIMPPTWLVKNDGSFASVSITLPPNTNIHCESDAVVTMSQNIDVQGSMSGGILAGLARAFLTRESFFTTQVSNNSTHQSGDVLVAPSDPGGVALHRLVRGEEMILTSGAYLAGDDGVNISSSVASPFSSFSNFSGTGIFLLRASGQGNLALCAFGSMIKYTLAAGEQRSVDNGHIVAYSASMTTSMKLASARAGILGSMTSGEGLHCSFSGPGVVYVQSHKPRIDGDGVQRTRNGGGRSTGNPIIACAFFLFFTLVILGIIFAVNFGGGIASSGGYSEYNRGHQYRQNQRQQRQNQQQRYDDDYGQQREL